MSTNIQECLNALKQHDRALLKAVEENIKTNGYHKCANMNAYIYGMFDYEGLIEAEVQGVVFADGELRMFLTEPGDREYSEEEQDLIWKEKWGTDNGREIPGDFPGWYPLDERLNGLLTPTLVSIAQGLGKEVRVECTRIEWDTDGEDAGLPESDSLSLVVPVDWDEEDIFPRAVDTLTNKYGFCIRNISLELARR